ncbi:MAG TPA: quinone oxidoreductase, partial [Acidimicrobiia bacterium]
MSNVANRGISISETGGPEVLVYGDLPEPGPGPSEVVVEIAGAGVNFIDTYHRIGLYPMDMPFTPGL